MKQFLLILVVGIVTLINGADLTWSGFGDGYALVKAKKKPAIIDFYTDWCMWCKTMDEKTFHDPLVMSKLKKEFVTMRINPETSKETINFDGKSFTPAQFAQALGVQGYPAIAFMDGNGQFIALVPGYSPPDKFLDMLTYVKDECYTKKVTMEEWTKKGKKCK